MKIVIDRNIPFAAGPLAEVAEVVSLPGVAISREALRDADALITRTRTRCDASTLADTAVSFVGTATIGTDHIDLPYCRDHGIEVANAPGCNAPAVAQWLMAAVSAWLPEGKPLSDLTIGVVGAGHVGQIVIRWARGLGMNVLVCDPPRAEAEGASRAYPYVSLDRIAAEADVITFHTPLTREGAHPTFHLADRAFLSALRRRPLLLNAARGPVADNAALVEALDSGLLSAVGIDCWEGEPAISDALLDRALVATPHIAGYSREGKIRATQMVLDALARHFSLPPLAADAESPKPVAETVSPDTIDYDILADSRALKAAPHDFELLRNTYPLRPESRDASTIA